jgi:hypothetical protein
MYVRRDGRLCPSLAPEGLDGFYSYLVYKNLSIAGRGLVNITSLAKKIMDLQVGPKVKWRFFSKTALSILTKFQYFIDTITLNGTA